MQQFLDAGEPGKARVVVDTREDRFFDECLEEGGAHVDRRMLDVGDFLVSAKLVVERKTRDDFEQSIVDGRLFRQLASMKENYGSVVVIVEGDEDAERLSRNALLGAYSSIIADYGAALFFTDDMEGTAELVLALAKHEQLARKQPMRIFARKKAHTLSQSQRAVVESLPGVGPKLAKAILRHFGSVDAVVKAGERELKEVEGMGPKRAKVIRSVLSKEYNAKDDPL